MIKDNLLTVSCTWSGLCVWLAGLQGMYEVCDSTPGPDKTIPLKNLIGSLETYHKENHRQ